MLGSRGFLRDLKIDEDRAVTSAEEINDGRNIVFGLTRETIDASRRGQE